MTFLPNARPRYQPGQRRTPRRRPGLRRDVILFGVSFAVFLGAAIFFFYTLDTFNRDALSRTVDAHNVLASRDAHLGAIGLAWPPIPTFMRVVLMPITSRVGLTEFTGPLTSVVGAAGCVVVLNRTLVRFGLTPWTRGTWIVATMANPVLLYHFVNGTAESVFSVCFLVVLLASLDLLDHPERAVIGMGLATGLALWVRYEAVAIMGMAIVGFLLMGYLYRGQGAWRDRARSESLLVTLTFPTIALGILWLSFNWTMQGDPLFFYHGPYSINAATDVAKNVPDHPLAFAYGSPAGTVQYVAERSLQLSFLFPVAVVGTFAVGIWRRDVIGPILALLTLSTLTIQAYQTYSGTIAPWLRYWVYLPLFTPVLLGWLMQAHPMLLRQTSMTTFLRLGLVPGLILLSGAISYVVMGHEDVSPDEQLVVHEIAGGDAAIVEELRSYYPDRGVLAEVQAYLDQTAGIVLVDVQKAGPLIIDWPEADRLAINTDRDFELFVANPIGKVSYILLPDPLAEGAEVARDAIYNRYPDLYEGAAWLALEQEFVGTTLDWRLYRVLGGTP